MTSPADENPFAYSDVEQTESGWTQLRSTPSQLRRSPSSLQYAYVALFMVAAGLIGLAGLVAIFDDRLQSGVVALAVSGGCILLASGLNQDQRWAIWTTLLASTALVPIAYRLLDSTFLSWAGLLLSVGMFYLLKDHARRRRRFPDLD